MNLPSDYTREIATGLHGPSFFAPLDSTHFHNKSANALALCHPPSASFCSVLAVQWSSRIFTHDRYNIPSDILIEFEVNLGIIIEKYA